MPGIYGPEKINYMYLILINNDTVRLVTYSFSNEWEIKGNSLILYNGRIEDNYIKYIRQKLRDYVHYPYCYQLITDYEEQYVFRAVFLDNWVALDMKLIKRYVWGYGEEKYSIWDRN